MFDNKCRTTKAGEVDAHSLIIPTPVSSHGLANPLDRPKSQILSEPSALMRMLSCASVPKCLASADPTRRPQREVRRNDTHWLDVSMEDVCRVDPLQAGKDLVQKPVKANAVSEKGVMKGMRTHEEKLRSPSGCREAMMADNVVAQSSSCETKTDVRALSVAGWNARAFEVFEA